MSTAMFQLRKMNSHSRSGVSSIFIICVAFVSLILGYYTAKFCAVYFFGYKDKVRQRKVTLQEQVDAAQLLVDYAIDNFERIVNGEITESEVISYRNDVYWPVFFKLRPADSNGNRGSINEGPFCHTLGLGVYLGLIMDPEQQEFIEVHNSFNRRYGLRKSNAVRDLLSDEIKTAIAEIKFESLELKIDDQKPEEISHEDQVEAARLLVDYAVENRERIESGTITETEAISYQNEVYWPVFNTLRPLNSEGNRDSTTEGPFVQTLELGFYLGVIMNPEVQENISKINELNRKLLTHKKSSVSEELSVKIDSAVKEIKVESGEMIPEEETTPPSQSNSQVGPVLVVPETTAPIPNGPEGIKFLTSKAEQGDADAQLRLGIRYYNGDGTAKNTEEAVAWFRKAAEQGHGEAQYRLAKCYCDGIGVQQDYTEGIRWHQKAAEQGIASSQSFLAISYYTGEGVEQNYSEAFNWAQRAANQDDVLSQCLLGDCYSEGHGVAENLEKAVVWYRKSAEQGFAKAQARLGYCYFDGKGIERDPIEAIKWMEKAAEQGSVGAQYNLGVCYYEGDGIEQDYAKSLKWFLEAAKQGDSDAQCKTGVCYMLGQGIDPDSFEAVKWFHKAAEQGNVEAQYFLGLCYEEGDGVEKNTSEAMKWYKLAAERGDIDAKNRLKEIGSR